MREKHPNMLAIHQCISIQNPETADQQQTFGRLRYLRQHMHTHRADKKHLCDECGKAFKAKSYLAVHRQTHKEKSYSCSHITLQRHLTKIHGMDKATVNRMTAARNQNQTQDQASAESGEGTELPVLKPDDAQPIQETVNLIMDSDISSEQLQTMLEIGQLVIATDGSDNTINYEVADITMGVDCHTLIENEEAAGSSQTILIPHPAECSQIILQQEPETVPADVET
nr:hypothetical protein BaRGS_017840 [Batillaria attramentaria]